MPVEGGSGIGDVFVDPETATPSHPNFPEGSNFLDSAALQSAAIQSSAIAGELNAGLEAGEKDQESRVVTARGTEHGLVLRIDGKSDWSIIRAELEHFLGGRKKFFEGGEVSIEWIDRLPAPEQAKELGDALRAQYGLTVVTRRRRFAVEGRSSAEGRPGGVQRGSTINLFQDSEAAKADAGRDPIRGEAGRADHAKSELTRAELLARTEFGKALRERIGASDAVAGGGVGLTDHRGREGSGRGSSKMDSGERSREMAFAELGLEGLEEFGLGEFRRNEGGARMSDSGEFEKDSGVSSARRVASQMARMLGGPDLFYEDEANAKILFGTLRSGQRVETPFSLVVIGDVNPGADLVAGGDIIVLGSLKGTAHASAYDDDAFDRVIIALHMQPMQLRIGSVLSRGSEEVVRGAEIARIENRRIIVEAYNPRMMWGKKLR